MKFNSITEHIKYADSIRSHIDKKLRTNYAPYLLKRRDLIDDLINKLHAIRRTGV